jgi:hypothetical protein
VDEDASGLTFEEWDPTENADSSQMPVVMIINSNELRAAGFTKCFPKSFRPRHAVGARVALWYCDRVWVPNGYTESYPVEFVE